MNGDTEAVFTALYDVVYDDVLRYVTRRLHPDGAGAEDVVAEAMTTAWRRRRDLPRELDDARAWVFGIARGCLLNDARSRRRRTALGVRLASVEGRAVSADGADLAISRADLARAWSHLSDDQQDVLSLTVFEGLDSARAGQVLSITAAAYRVRLARARSALARDLDGDSRAGSTRPLYEETR